MKNWGISVFCFLFFSAGAHADGEFIVALKKDFNIQSLVSAKGIAEMGLVEVIPELNIVITKKHPSEMKGIQGLAESIRYVQVNERRQFLNLDQIGVESETQSSPPYSQLWGLNAIGAQSAWEISKGEGVLVAVSDTGIQLSHWNLEDNIWSNPGETGTDAQGKNKAKNKVDDDGNGYVDDLHGWDFISKKAAALDNHYHGTHVAGTIAARDGGTGPVAGVAPRAKLVVTTFLDSQGYGTDLGGAKSLLYGVTAGARIINCSWGGAGFSQVIHDAMVYAQSKGVLIIAASGNDGVDTDKEPHFPSTTDLDNVISVGATSDAKGSRAWFSNFGRMTVDIAAPGMNIRSTANMFWGLKYPFRTLSGTSMATPHVSGVAALVWSLHPEYTYRQVRKTILETAAPAKDWKGISVTESILRADQAVKR